MKLVRALSLAAVMLPLFTTSLRAHAQMPTDNDTWKKRCELLRDSDPNGRGATSADWLIPVATKVDGPRWTTFGWDRYRAKQPYVACTFFYLGAIADHRHGNGHADKVHAHESGVMGRISDKMAKNETVTEREKLTRTHAEAAEIPKPALTVPEEEAMVMGATTMPLEAPTQAMAMPAQKPSPNTLKAPRSKR